MWTIFCCKEMLGLLCCVDLKINIWKPSEDKGLDIFVLSHIATQAGGIGEGHLQKPRFHGEQTYWVTCWYGGLWFVCNDPRWQMQHFIACETAFEVEFFWVLIQPCSFGTGGVICYRCFSETANGQWREKRHSWECNQILIQQTKYFASAKPCWKYFFSSWEWMYLQHLGFLGILPSRWAWAQQLLYSWLSNVLAHAAPARDFTGWPLHLAQSL